MKTRERSLLTGEIESTAKKQDTGLCIAATDDNLEAHSIFVYLVMPGPITGAIVTPLFCLSMLASQPSYHHCGL